MADVLADKPAEVQTLYGMLGIRNESDLKQFCKEFARRTIQELDAAAQQRKGVRLLTKEELFVRYVEIRVWQGDVNFLKGAISDWQRWRAGLAVGREAAAVGAERKAGAG